MKAYRIDLRFIVIVLALLLAGAAACQWGLREGEPGDGEVEGEEEDGIDGTDIDVSVEDGREDPAAEEADLEDVPDGEGGCTSDGECDDGDPCNGEEACGDDGICAAGTPLDDGTGCATTAVPDGVCRGGVCVSVLCGNGEVDDGEECDDGNEVADDGCEINCAYSCHAAAACNDDEFCTIDSCVPNTAGMICEYENSTDSCDDDSACTESDTCSGGTCSGTAVDCDDDDDCTDDGCEAATGCTHAFNTTGCDDGNDCTGGDTCDGAGTCAGTTFTCPCTVLTDCDVYDDGDLCNGRLLCDTDGFCKIDPSSVVTCDSSGDTDCLKNLCDPDTGLCGMQPEPDGTDCDDADACTDGEACDAGDCTGGASVSCDDHLDCTEDSCSPADGCHYTALTGTACEDGNLCTAPDVCSAGSCVSGADVSCGDLNDCTSDTCNPADGCHHTDLTGTACSDGDPCTSPDVCQSGACVPGTNICGCTVNADCLPYEDGDPCNGTLVCDASGDCVVDPATIITCDPSSDTDCLKNRCDPSTGDCRMWEEPNGTTCTDGSVCTPVDLCASGLCTGTGTLPCGDGNVCTDDGCDPVTGCTHDPNTDPCDDGLYCTRTDRCNGLGTCIGTGATCDDGFACTTDTCNEGTNSCSNAVSAGFCLIGGVCITDGTVNPDNDCQECDDAASRTAWSPRASGTVCDDGLYCTRTDLCNSSGTCVGAGATCDDGLVCTTDACNETANSCSNTLQSGFCLIGGICRTSGTDNPANDCQACVPGSSTTSWTNKSPGSTCAGDGVGCTADACNGSGVCVSTPDDTSCTPGDLCRPACSVDGSGCVTPPSPFELTCTSPVTLPAASDCTINLSGLAGQTGCLACRSEAGMVLLDYSDFGDETGSCHADGWTLLNAGCSDSVDACTPAGTGTCCTDFASICEATTTGEFILRTNQATNCPAAIGREQWRMTKTFDTTGLTNLQLCFSVGDRDATSNEGLLVQVAEGASISQVYCLNGPPQPFVNNVLYPTCVNLPVWAEGKAAVAVTFIMHSEDNWDWLLLDSVSLRGWVSGCTPTTATALSETFGSCALGAWTVTGTPACPGTWGCAGAGNGLQAVSETWSIERSVDASGLDGNVTLCFAYGDNNTASPGYLRAEFNARDGAGWRTAWLHTGKMGNNQTCREVCVNLSDIDADVNRNAGLGIRFTVQETAGGTIDLDTISLRGAVYCDGAGKVTLSSIIETGGGLYTFTATDTAATMLDADVQCTWDTPAVPIGDWASIRYRR
jgi:hypothetical protein